MLLGAEDRADLEHALIDADHGLLVKLRTLRKIRALLEVFQPEDVRAALGALALDLRRVYLREALRKKIVAEAAAQSLLNAEDAPLAQIAQGDGAQVHMRVEVQVHFPLRHRHGQRLGRAGEDLDFLEHKLVPAGRAGFLMHPARDDDGGLFDRAAKVKALLRDALDDAVALAQR